MKKYLHIIKITMSSMMVYRSNLFFTVFGEFLSFLVMLYLWKVIYDNGNQAGPYTLAGLAIYYLFAKLVSITTKSNVAFKIGEDVFYGRISNYLLKPFSHFRAEASSCAGSVLFNLIAYSPLFIIAVFLLETNSSGSAISNYLFFFFFLLTATTMNYLIFYMLGLSALFFGNIGGIAWAFMNILGLVSGSIIPLDLIPPFWRTIIEQLPFKFMAYIPAQTIRGNYSLHELLQLSVSALGWLIILYALVLLISRIGFKRYEANGA